MAKINTHKKMAVDPEIVNTQKKPVKNDLESSKLYVGIMVGLMIFGLVYLIVSYISNGALFRLGNWNLVVGFVFIIVGFAMTTKWK
jgi:positive regulator of sigma E activity